MVAMLRLAIVGFVVMTVLYVLLSIYSRSLRREELEKEWDAAQGPGERGEYIEAGMAAYQTGLRRKLLWLVYVIPTLVFLVLLYVLNFG
jgi:Ca2+/Na+ antiporter